jgi:hypothetical protein
MNDIKQADKWVPFLLYIRCQADHFNGCDKFKFIDVSLTREKRKTF